MRKGIAKGIVNLAKSEDRLEVIEMAQGWQTSLEEILPFASKGEKSKVAEILARVKEGIEAVEEMDSPRERLGGLNELSNLED